MQQRLPKFQPQPEAVAHHTTTDRDLEILYAIAHYRLLSTSLLLRLIPGSPKGTANRLRILFHKTLIERMPGRINEESVYYIRNLDALRLLQARGIISADAPEWDSVRNRQKLGKPPAQLTLDHELMISRFHATLQLACRQTNGQVQLASW